MKTDFIQEVIENEDLPRYLDALSGWEAVVFQVEDDVPVILSEAKELK